MCDRDRDRNVGFIRTCEEVWASFAEWGGK